MLDVVVRGMFTPPAEVPFTNMNTNTISSIMCISDAPVCCLKFNSWGETVHAHSTVSKGSKTFQYTFVLLYLDIILYSDRLNYIDSFISNFL